MIPSLSEGVLPEGIYSCTIEEVERLFGRFQKSERRSRLTERLRKYIEEATKAGLASALIIDGSYVTAKPEPSDIDIILVIKPEFDLGQELRPFEYNVQSRRRVRRAYGFDILSAVEGSRAYNNFLDLFHDVRRDDPEQATFPARKGILRIPL